MRFFNIPAIAFAGLYIMACQTFEMPNITVAETGAITETNDSSILFTFTSDVSGNYVAQEDCSDTEGLFIAGENTIPCLLYTSPSPRD